MSNEISSPLACMQEEDGTCAGPVELRESLTGTGVPMKRCAKHQSDRLDLEQRLRRDYPDSDTPPAWFDPANAGETWNSDY